MALPSSCASICFFFFSSRRRHTRCSRDWSSDVCSSDLQLNPELGRETEYELLLEVEELLERAVGLRTRPNSAVTAHHRRRHADRAVLRNRGNTLHHPFCSQEMSHACGGAGGGAPALAQLQLIE